MALEILKEFLDIKLIKDAKGYSHLAIPKFTISKEEDQLIKHFEEIFLDGIEKIWIENNFINIIFKPKILDIYKGNLGRIFNLDKETLDKNSKNKVLIEHTSNNPTGPIHIGRIRNTLIGDFLSNLYEKFNYKVERHFYVNDLGKQVILIYYGFKNNYEEKIDYNDEKLKKYLKYKDREDFKTFFVYNLVYEDLKEAKINEEEINNLLLKAENDEILRKSLKNQAEFALKGIKKTFKRLNVNFDSFDFESDFLDSAKKYIRILKDNFGEKDPLLIKLTINGKKEEIYLTRENGTTTYTVRDIAYHKWKEKIAKKLVNVLGEDHKREFEVLKELLKILDFNAELNAVFYSFLTLNGQKFSTRKGNILTVDEFIDEGKKLLQGSEEEKENLAIAALKAFLLKTHINKPIDFVWEEAVKIEGETGIYLIYSLVRAKSILRKSSYEIFRSSAEKKTTDELVSILEELIGKIDYNNIKEHELSLFMKALFYVETLKETFKRKNPATLMNYLFEFSQLFNNYYAKEKIIGSNEEFERLFFVLIYKAVMEDALEILNIPIVEEIKKFSNF